MTDIFFPQLAELARSAQAAYHKLVIIAGPSGAGKTRHLTQLAADLKLPVMNLNLQLSRRLLNLTRRQRMLKAEEVARDAIDEHTQSQDQDQASLCLDNTELLFDSALNLNPLAFLQAISRNRLIIATWNGALENGELRFAYPGHPDFFRKPANGYPVVTVSQEKLQLHLTS